MDSIIYEDQELTGERLELTSKEGNYYLGPNLTLRSCTVVTGVTARWLHILPARFIDCAFEVRRELKRLSWLRAELKGCRFKGRLHSCEFGHWPDYSFQCESGSIEGCDFTEARLEDCRFHNCDMSTLRLPRWPHFTLLDPVRNAPTLTRVQWPGDFGTLDVKVLSKQPPSTSAITLYAPTVARECGSTLDVLKALVEQFDCFVF